MYLSDIVCGYRNTHVFIFTLNIMYDIEYKTNNSDTELCRFFETKLI